MIANKNQEIKIRVFKLRDLLTIFQWRNDKITVFNSLSEKKVSLTQHLIWFTRKKLNFNNFKGYIISNETDRIAFVFFNQISDNCFEISVNLSPTFRGQGLAKKAIFLALSSITGVQNYEIIARVKHQNIRSKKLFQSCNFVYIRKLSNSDYSYYKKII